MRRQGATVVLTTHAVVWLPKADRIICTKEGAISFVGTYAELMHPDTGFDLSEYCKKPEDGEEEVPQAADAIQMANQDGHDDDVARAAAQPEAVPPPVRCSICLDDLYGDSVHPVHMLKCAHAFHSKCIMQWGDCRERSCPICWRRGDVPKTPR